MITSDKKNVLVVNSVYSLLYYMLLFDTSMGNTILISSGGIDKEYVNKINDKVTLKKGRLGIFDVVLKLFFNAKFRNVVFKRCDKFYFGHDHLYYSFLFVKNMNLIEDGLLNYSKSNRFFPVNVFLKNRIPGDNALVKNIYLSGLKSVPSSISNKTIVNSIYDVWNNLPAQKKQYLNGFFNLEINRARVDSLILTQPLSEYGILTEVEKIEIYKNIYNKIKMGNKKINIVIKPHPRETTDYKSIFPDSNVLLASCPSELLSLNSEKITNVHTLYSTSIYNFKYANKYIYGTSISKKLVDAVGLIEGNIK